MLRFEILPHRFWKNHATGASASAYGAAPFVSDADAKDWTLVTAGFTIRDNKRGTTGIGRPPFATAEAAQAHMDAHPLVFRQSTI